MFHCPKEGHLLVVEKFNTEVDIPHVTSHSSSVQSNFVASLKFLIDGKPTSGAYPSTAIPNVVVDGELCLMNPVTIFVDPNIGLFIIIIGALITECNQIDSGMGGSKYS